MKKNLPLIFAISVPVILVIGVALTVYLPTLFVKPEYNFLYASGSNYIYRDLYVVENGTLVKKPIIVPGTVRTTQEPKLYMHDVSKNVSVEISFEEAQRLSLDTNTQSPDDFEIAYGSGGGGFFPFLFWSEGNYGERYLKGRGISKKLNLQTSYGSYSSDFRFLGWIK